MSVRLIEEDSLEELIHELQGATEAYKAAAERKEILQELVVQKLREERHKSKTVADNFDSTKQLRAVMVANRRTKVDEKGLRKAIGAKLFHKVSIEKVDMAMLEEAVISGELDGTTVKQYLTQTEHPTVRLYVIDKREDEADGPDE